jgi:hypothetical protein
MAKWKNLLPENMLRRFGSKTEQGGRSLFFVIGNWDSTKTPHHAQSSPYPPISLGLI